MSCWHCCMAGQQQVKAAFQLALLLRPQPLLQSLVALSELKPQLQAQLRQLLLLLAVQAVR